MRKHLWPFVVAAWAALFLPTRPAAAASVTYGRLTFTPPAGWQVQTRESDMVLSGVDQAKGIYMLILISKDQPGSGATESMFASEWKALARGNFPGAAAPETSAGALPSGLKYREGTASVTLNANPALATLLVLDGGSRIQSVLFITPGPEARQAFEPQLLGFLGGLSMAGAPGGASRPSLPAPSVNATPSSPADRGRFEGAGIAGVWMGFKSAPILGSYEPQPRWTVFFTDGRVFEDLPDEGLDHFDRARSQADPARGRYWGTYTLAGGQGAITKPGARFPTRIAVLGADKITLDDVVFNRCRNPKGLRLEGAWTSYSNPRDPALGALPEGKRPVIAFDRTGKFADGGIFATLLRTNWGAEDPIDAAGTGSYAFGDYTLVLRYDDGRVLEVAFTALLSADPANTNDILFFRRNHFNKFK